MKTRVWEKLFSPSKNMLIIRVKENDRAPGLRRRWGRRAVTPSFLSSFMALPWQDSVSSGDSMLHISPHTLAPPGSATQEPLGKSNLSTRGVTGTLSTGAQGVPYKFTPLLTSQEPLLHLFTMGTVLPCGRHTTIIADEPSGTVFRVPWTVRFTSVLSSTKGNELCLQYMNPAGQ